MEPPRGPKSEADPVASAAEAWPRDPAVIARSGETSYAELEQRIRQVAGAMRFAGVGEGDRVAVWAVPTVDTVASLWAAPRIGATAVPINTRWSPTETARVIGASGSNLAVVADGAPDLGIETLTSEDMARAAQLDETGFVASAPQCIIFTSGSAGKAKGAILTGENLLTSARASQRHLGNGHSDRWLTTLPLYHVGGFAILWRSATAGGAVVLEPFDAQRVALLIGAKGADIASFVPAMVRALLTHDAPLDGLKYALAGGGPVPEELVEAAAGRGLKLLRSYGMTEMASQVATVHPADQASPRGSTGRVLSGVQLQIRHGGEVTRPGEAGSITVGGPMLSPGYVGEPPRPGHMFVTGDVGFVDEAGYLTVLGRSDDVIVSGGENVHPDEVEAAIVSLGDVADAAVVGVAHPRWDEAVAAAVVLDNAQLGREELRTALVGDLADFKIPKLWAFVESIPRNDLGKIDRAAITRLFDETSN